MVDEAEKANRLKVDFYRISQAQPPQQGSIHVQPHHKKQGKDQHLRRPGGVCKVLTFFVVVPPGSPGALRRSRSPDQPEGRARGGRDLRRSLY